MKTLTCSVCSTHTETAETDEMVMDQIVAHVSAQHADEAAKMEAMSQEERDAMMADVRSKIVSAE